MTNTEKSARNKNVQHLRTYDGTTGKSTEKRGEFLGREFIPRNTLLTDFYENRHALAIYRFAIAIFLSFLVTSALKDVFYKNTLQLCFPTVFESMANFHVVLLVLICLFLLTFLVYGGFKCWAIIRTGLNSSHLKLWDGLCLTIFIMLLAFVLSSSALVTIKYDLSVVLSTFSLGETSIYVMKIYAFVRSNVPRALKYKQHTENQILCPAFSKFLYFLAAPTLIYRDNYPRTKEIRWKYVLQCFTEFLGILFLLYFLYERYEPIFKTYGTQPFSAKELLVGGLENWSAGLLLSISIWYGILESLMNAFAELTRFGDRMFYDEWWTATTYVKYFRTWNGIIYDWLHTYVYKDIQLNVFPKNKLAANSITILVSALFHDYIVGFSYKFFVPYHLIFFFCIGGFILPLIKMNNDVTGNVFVLFALFGGCTTATNLYVTEYYFRINCPVENSTLSSYFIPRLLACEKFLE